MHRNLKKLLGMAVAAAALAGGPALSGLAHAPNRDGPAGMMHGGQDGMMGMMRQMNRMMETCNEMMREMARQHGSGASEEGESPERKD